MPITGNFFINFLANSEPIKPATPVITTFDLLIDSHFWLFSINHYSLLIESTLHICPKNFSVFIFKKIRKIIKLIFKGVFYC